jgi:hypothetical protein
LKCCSILVGSFENTCLFQNACFNWEMHDCLTWNTTPFWEMYIYIIIRIYI